MPGDNRCRNKKKNKLLGTRSICSEIIKPGQGKTEEKKKGLFLFYFYCFVINDSENHKYLR